MGILPFAQLTAVFDVLVGHIHPSGESDLVVDHQYFSVVPEIEGEQEVTEPYGHYGVDLYPDVPELFLGPAPEPVTAKGVVDDPDHHAFSYLSLEEFQHFVQ